MEILAKPTDWTQFDEEKLAALLDSETGKRLIVKLLDARPPLLESGDTNAILIRSGVVAAYDKMLNELVALAHPPVPTSPPESAFPALEDDSKWNDGQRLTPETPETPKA